MFLKFAQFLLIFPPFFGLQNKIFNYIIFLIALKHNINTIYKKTLPANLNLLFFVLLNTKKIFLKCLFFFIFFNKIEIELTSFASHRTLTEIENKMFKIIIIIYKQQQQVCERIINGGQFPDGRDFYRHISRLDTKINYCMYLVMYYFSFW